MVILQWGELKFGVDGNTATLFEKLKITAECETEDKEENTQQYVSGTKGKPVQVTFTAKLSAYLGVDVKASAMKLLNSAQRSAQSNLYMAGVKIFPFPLMMTKADISEVEIAPGGKWTEVQADITMKQSGKDWMSDYGTYASGTQSGSTGTGTGTDTTSSGGGSGSSGSGGSSSATSRIDHAIKATNATGKTSASVLSALSSAISKGTSWMTKAKSGTSTTTKGSTALSIVTSSTSGKTTKKAVSKAAAIAKSKSKK